MRIIIEKLIFSIKLIVIITTILVTSCSNSIVIDSDFPQPVGKIYPITAGLIFNDAFKNFIHHENQDDRDEWTINTGLAQQKMFNVVLDTMFDETVNLTKFPDPIPKNIDILIVPEILEFQFTMPRETSVNIFEVWIKYNVHTYNKQGESIAEWIITAYGKTPTAFLKSEGNALKEAVKIALRDAGATLYSGFYNVPGIQNFIISKQRENSIKKPESLIVDSNPQ